MFYLTLFAGSLALLAGRDVAGFTLLVWCVLIQMLGRMARKEI